MFESLDRAVTVFFNTPAGNFPVLDSIATFISAYAVPTIVVLVAVQWFLRDDKQRRRHALVATGLAFLLGLGLNQVILLFVHRTRPYDAGVTKLIIEKSADWSFPSDHATAVVAIAATFAMLGLRKHALWFGIGAVLVCWSRLYVGIHYAGDVLGGGLTGLIAAAAVTKVYLSNSKLNQALIRIL
jgi:undecaprenyl-diphosphatase